MTSGKPRLAITLGDPAGIGPEIVAKALAALRPELAEVECAIHGDPRVARGAGVDPSFPIVAAGDFDPARDPLRAPTARSGAAAAAALFSAIEAARSGAVEAIVTAPLSKEALHRAGVRAPGQTEILIESSGARRAVMTFVGGGIKVALSTRHVALRDVVSRLEPEAIADDLAILAASLRRDFGIASPRIAVCGVNPHAGEHGLFGDEETRVLAPAVDAARKATGAAISDPLPADTLFVKLRRGEFDLALAMYHDQGLIPVKLLAFGGGVNVSLGLPFVRTSPDHGTAYDIAGTGRADPGSMVEAIRLAIAMVRARATA